MADLDFDIFSGVGGITQGAFARVMGVFAIIVLVIIGIGFLFYYIITIKKYYITIELYKRVDGQTKFVRKYRSCEFRIGKAGDILWYVAKANKYIPPANNATPAPAISRAAPIANNGLITGVAAAPNVPSAAPNPLNNGVVVAAAVPAAVVAVAAVLVTVAAIPITIE